MNDFRIKIAAFAVVLGLGGLGGYALSAQPAPQTPVAAPDKPKTQVVRRTVHVKPKIDKSAAPPSAGAAGSYSPPATSTASSGGGSVVSAPVSTGSSGGGGGAYGGGEGESEREGGGDD